jgi:hypothetical protein
MARARAVTYSGLFKRELAMQTRPADPAIAARVGTPPSRSYDQRSGVFAALEPRLRGTDAVDGLVEHLRLRLVQQRTACAATDGTANANAVDDADALPKSTTPFIDHGPPFEPPPPVHFHVWTIGVV